MQVSNFAHRYTKYVLKSFCGSAVIFVVVPEKSDCKIWKCCQEMSKFKPGVFKLCMLNK